MPDASIFNSLQQEISEHSARLVAVSKTKPQAAIKALYDLGQRDFGENRVAELVEKNAALPSDIRWHFIGHLQRNKVKAIAPFVHLVHAVDSARLLREINKQAEHNGRTIDVLLQFHIAQESSKYGLDPAEAHRLLTELQATPCPNARIVGVMGMATYTDNQKQVAAEFRALREIFDTLKQAYFSDQPTFKEISMGMSGDYPLALKNGSTIVRVGSLLFGARG